MFWGTPIQVSYVTANLDRACVLLGERHGITAFYRPDIADIVTDAGDSMTLRLAHAWWGTTWIEVIEPVGGAVNIYRDWLPGEGGTMRLHHFGIHVATREALEEARNAVIAAGREVLFSITRPRGTNLFYVDTSIEFGHFLEFFFFPDLQSSTLARIPNPPSGLHLASCPLPPPIDGRDHRMPKKADEL